MAVCSQCGSLKSYNSARCPTGCKKNMPPKRTAGDPALAAKTRKIDAYKNELNDTLEKILREATAALEVKIAQLEKNTNIDEINRAHKQAARYKEERDKARKELKKVQDELDALKKDMGEEGGGGASGESGSPMGDPAEIERCPNSEEE